MISIEHIAKTPSVKTGLFATLRACLHGAGSGASSLDRRLTSTMLATLCALAGVLVLAAVPALALRGHAFSKSFGSGPCVVGPLEPCEGQLKEPSGVAVSEATGDVYVVDKGNNRVEYFNSNGVFQGQFNGSGSNPVVEGKAAGSGGLPNEIATGQFSSPGGIAVDNACHFQEVKLKHALSEAECTAFDPSAGDVYVADHGNKVVDKFSATGEYVGQITQTPSGTFEELLGVAVDTGGQVWVHKHSHGDHVKGDVVEFGDGVLNEFVEPDHELSGGRGFGIEGSLPFAVDSHDNFYSATDLGAPNHELRVDEWSTDGEALVEELDNEQSSGVAVDLSSDEVFVDNVTSVGGFSASGVEQERFGSGGSLAGGAGLAVGHPSSPLYSTVYAADSAANDVVVFGPEPPGPPTLEANGESVSEVTADSATFAADVNLRSDPSESPVPYRFQYGACAPPATPASCGASPFASSVPVPDGTLAAGFETVTATAHAQGLLPDTVYHVRVVVEREPGKPVEGEERIFTTQPAGAGLVLPDGRQWELVSPPDKHGATVIPYQGSVGLDQAAEDGGGIVYRTDVPTEPEPPGYGQQGLVDQVRSVRGPGGWSTRDIATPHDTPTGIEGFGSEYAFFSADLSSGLADPAGEDNTLLSALASEQTMYVRREALCDSPASAAECYWPVLTGKEGVADVPPSTQFGPEPAEPGKAKPRRVRFVGASPDLRHVFMQSSGVALTGTPVSPGQIYEWSAGAAASEAVQLISVLPASEGGGPAAAGEIGVGLGRGESQGARHSISSDGSRVFWLASSIGANSGALYLRDTRTRTTLRLDLPQPGAPAGGTPSAKFQIASADGSRVFFTDEQPLTSDSGAHERAPDLYECEIREEAGALACRLSDLTPASAGHSAEVRNLVSGAGEDGAYVYFVANEVLSENTNSHGDGATQGTCDTTAPPPTATCNLYAYHAGKIAFVATLSQSDEAAWGLESPTETVTRLTAYASPDGQFFTFMSFRSLTGYDNRDAASGKPDAEVYLYDAVSGRLACVSCNPTGARPHGIEGREFNSSVARTPAHAEDVAGVFVPQTGFSTNVLGDWFAGSLTPGGQNESEEGRFQPSVLADGGRLFFNSSDALVPQDVNENEDVYEYEPAGYVGSEGNVECTDHSATFSPSSGGCTSLISSGTSPEESGFLAASKSGDDVFFLTNSRLTAQDVDTARDVYDAHVCSSAVPCVTPTTPAAPCLTAEACRGAPAPQPSIFGPPASATFNGPGNVTPTPPVTPKVTKKTVKCKNGLVKNKKNRCVRKKKKKAKRSSARRAGNDRGAKS